MGWRWSSRDLANLNWAVGLAVIVATSLCIQAEAQNKKYGPGVQDDEIVIGQMPEWIPGTDHQDPHSRHLEEDVDRARG